MLNIVGTLNGVKVSTRLQRVPVVGRKKKFVHSRMFISPANNSLKEKTPYDLIAELFCENLVVKYYCVVNGINVK